MLWSYDQHVQWHPDVERYCVAETCLFCRVPLRSVEERCYDTWAFTGVSNVEKSVRMCPWCGWWVAQKCVRSRAYIGRNLTPDRSAYKSAYGSVGCLAQFDDVDATTPLHEIRAYLARDPETRFRLTASQFEQVVGSVFSDFGYLTEVSGRSGDGGVDVVLRDSFDRRIGVQVKRWRQKVKVEQLRALLGALVVGDYTRGIFVTTSSFQRGAPKFVGSAASRGYRLELLDAPHFLESLGLAQELSFERRIKSLRRFHDRYFAFLGKVRITEGPRWRQLK